MHLFYKSAAAREHVILYIYKRWCIACETQNPTTMVTRKMRSFVFSSKISFSNLFWPKTYWKHFRNLITPIRDLQKPNKPPQNPKTPEIKIPHELKFVVWGVFKVNKHLNTNPLLYEIYWHKNQSFWWSESLPSTIFSI